MKLPLGNLLIWLVGASIVAVATQARTVAASLPMFETRPAFSHVQWKTDPQGLPKSGASLLPPPGSRAIVGDADLAFNTIDEPEATEYGSFRHEESILRFDHLGTVRYEYYPDGYTIDDDFATLDPDKLMLKMRACGCPPVSISWGRKPVYDSARHIVTWVVLEHHLNGNIYGAYADVYTRFGRELIFAYTRDGSVEATYAELRRAIDAFVVFFPSRYEDRKRNDPLFKIRHIEDTTTADAMHRGSV